MPGLGLLEAAARRAGLVRGAFLEAQAWQVRADHLEGTVLQATAVPVPGLQLATPTRRRRMRVAQPAPDVAVHHPLREDVARPIAAHSQTIRRRN